MAHPQAIKTVAKSIEIPNTLSQSITKVRLSAAPEDAVGFVAVIVPLRLVDVMLMLGVVVPMSQTQLQEPGANGHVVVLKMRVAEALILILEVMRPRPQEPVCWAALRAMEMAKSQREKA